MGETGDEADLFCQPRTLVWSCDLVKHLVVSASLNGEQIDPVQAQQLHVHLRATKLWYDIQAAEFVMQGTLSDAQFQRVIDQIEKRALAAMKQEGK